MKSSSVILLLVLLPRLALGLSVDAEWCLAPGHVAVGCHEPIGCGQPTPAGTPCADARVGQCVDITFVATDAHQSVPRPYHDARIVQLAPGLPPPVVPGVLPITAVMRVPDRPPDPLSARALARAVNPRC